MVPRVASNIIVSGMLLCWFAGIAQATNLWVNGDMSGGTFTQSNLPQDLLPNGWGDNPPNNAADSKANVVNQSMFPGFAAPNGGTFYLAFQSASLAGQDCIFQEIPTIVGHTYTLSFYIAIVGAAATNFFFDPDWDANGTDRQHLDVSYYNGQNTASEPFMQFTFTGLTASSTSTLFYFHGTDACPGNPCTTNAILLDDVVVTDNSAVAEPASLLLIGSGLVVVGLRNKKIVDVMRTMATIISAVGARFTLRSQLSR